MRLRVDPEAILVPVLAVVSAMLVGMLLIYAIGFDAVNAYGSMVSGIFTAQGLGGTLIGAGPIILTGLAVAIAFRAGLFNIGANGQAIMGILGGGLVAIYLGSLPGALHWGSALVIAALAGGTWAAIAGLLKVTRGANEVVVTIMLNYIAIRTGEYLLRQDGGPLKEAGGSVPASEAFEATGRLPIIWEATPFTKVHAGILVALAMALLVWFIIQRTSLGYQIRTVGLNPDAALYGGMSTTKVIVVAMMLAGAMAGLGGATNTLGTLPRLNYSDFGALQIGFTGISVALLGRNTALGCVLAGLLIASLDVGAQAIQADGALPAGVGTKLIQAIQGLIVLFVGMELLFRRLSGRLLHLVGVEEDGKAAA